MRAIFAVAALLLPGLAWAGGVDQLKRFLEQTRTLRAEFTQTVTAKSGRKPQHSSGLVAIHRPGKLRWEIKKPYPQLMVGDGDKFWIYDQELAQVTIRKVGQAIGSTPAAILAGNNELERNFSLKDDGENDGVEWALAVPKKTDSGFDKLRIGFSAGELKAMELYDNFGQVTYIGFTHLERNPALPASLFRFVPPKGVDVVGE